MDIHRCILRIIPDFRCVVWDNDYDKIKIDDSETRPIPNFAELEAVWPEVEAQILSEQSMKEAKEKLIDLDLKSIRSIREWIVTQPNAPIYLKDYEAQAKSERERLK